MAHRADEPQVKKTLYVSRKFKNSNTLGPLQGCLEVTNHQHAEVDAWWNARPSLRVVIVRLAKGLDEMVEASVTQQRIQFEVKHVPLGSR